jgi:CHAT domain-containing protein
MADEEIVASEVVATEAPVTADVPAPEAAPVKETFDETLERVARQASEGLKRGPDGKFSGRDTAQATPAVEVPGSPQAAMPDPAPPVIEAPQSLPADVKAKWTTLPPEVQQYWSNRESEIHKKFTTDGERLKNLDRYDDALREQAEFLKANNIPQHEYVRRLAVADQMLRQNPQQALAWIAQTYGLNLNPGQQADPNSALVSEVQQLKSQLTQLRQADEAARLKLAEQRIEELAKERPYLKHEGVQEFMADFLENGRAKSPEEAYEMAINAHPEVRAEMVAKAKEEADKKAAEDAKAKAARDAKVVPLGKRPGSTPTAPIKGKNIWDTMDAVAKDVLARG